VILFLDFDGVLHPLECSPGERFGCLQRLEALLREPACAHVRIVVSSTWREAYTLEDLREFFSPDIRARVIGATPCLSGQCTRFEEIRAYLNGEPAGAQWCAVDDISEGFPPSEHWRVVFTDPASGLTSREVAKLRALLARYRA
jgi:hypothetical protein